MRKQLEDNELHQVLELLADTWFKQMHKCPSKDPFQSYAKSVQMHLYGDEERFRKRFVKGYQTLLTHVSP